MTQSDEKILKALAVKGPAWYYGLYKIEKIASNQTVLKSLKHLSSLGLLEEKKKLSVMFRGRKRTHYGLTFHGVLYALNLEFFASKEAANVRVRNFAEIPSARSHSQLEGSKSSGAYKQILETFFPQTAVAETERMQTFMKSQIDPETILLNMNIQRIIRRARKRDRNVRLHSMIEEEFSERIYDKLRKVNPDIKYYDEGIAASVFEGVHQECLLDFWARLLGSDDKACKKMIECLSDTYSVEVLQKGLFVYFARLFDLLKTPIESGIEFTSEEGIRQFRAEWTEIQKQLEKFSRMTSQELKAELASFPAKIKLQKRMMRNL